MELYLSAPYSYTITAFASALLQGDMDDINISLKVKHSQEFVHHKLRSDCPLFACFSSPFTWMILYFAGRKQVRMADKAAGFIKQSDQICLLGRWCGTTAMMEFGFVFIFVCSPVIFNSLKALGEFFITYPWALGSVCFSCTCTFELNSVDICSGHLLGRSLMVDGLASLSWCKIWFLCLFFSSFFQIYIVTGTWLIWETCE